MIKKVIKSCKIKGDQERC